MCWWVRLYFPGNRISYYRYGYSFMKKKIIAILVVLLLFIGAYRFASYYRLAQVGWCCGAKICGCARRRVDGSTVHPGALSEFQQVAPGMPADRGLFTENERFIVENKGFRGPAASTRFSVKHTKKQKWWDGGSHRRYDSNQMLFIRTLRRKLWQ